jgi:hypothetical protein
MGSGAVGEIFEPDSDAAVVAHAEGWACSIAAQ